MPYLDLYTKKNHKDKNTVQLNYKLEKSGFVRVEKKSNHNMVLSFFVVLFLFSIMGFMIFEFYQSFEFFKNGHIFEKINKVEVSKSNEKADENKLLEPVNNNPEILLQTRLLLSKREAGKIILSSYSPNDSSIENIFEFNLKETPVEISENITYEMNSCYAALSLDKKTIAYIDDGGLNLYNILEKKSISVIQKTKEALVSMRLPAEWSKEDLVGTYEINNPRSSFDSGYILFNKTDAEIEACGTINVETGEYIDIENKNGRIINCDNINWSPVGNELIVPEYGSDNLSGLYIFSVDRLDSRDISNVFKRGKDDFLEAVYSADGKFIAMILKENYEAESDILAISERSGKNMIILNDSGEKSDPIISNDGKRVYFFENMDENISVKYYDLEKNETVDILSLPSGYLHREKSAWISDNLLLVTTESIGVDTENTSMVKKFLIIDVMNKDIIYVSPEMSKDTNFIGLLN